MQDIQGHWAQPCIEVLLQRQVFTGYPDGTFRPEQAVTRAEFAALADRAFSLTPQQDFRVFADVPNTHWAIAHIMAVYQAGWLTGYQDGTFAPNKPMPRVQVLVALAAGLDLTPLHPPTPLVQQALQDAAAVPAYALPGLAAALENRLVVNYPNRRVLRPLQAATRAEVAAFIYQVIARQEELTSVLPERFLALGELADSVPSSMELRGVWLTNVDSEVLFSRENLAAGIARLAACHINTLYPTVWNGGFTLFPSAVAAPILGESQRLHPGLERSPRETAQGDRDMLQECLELGHAHAMRVIPWWEYGFFARRGNSLRPRRPDWFTYQQDGNFLDKHNMEWLNPFHPEVQEFVLRLIHELVTRYDIDGLQIDDHFGLPTEFGYDPLTTQLYRSETGKLAPQNPRDPDWMRWRADKITQFVQRVAHTVKSPRPQAIFSISPNPPEFSYQYFLQDWPRWLAVAEVNEVVIQTYRWTTSSFVNELRKPSIQALKHKVPISIGVLSGLKNRPMPLPILKQQCQAVRANGYAGMAFFFYESLWQTAGESPDLRQTTLKALLGNTANA